MDKHNHFQYPLKTTKTGHIFCFKHFQKKWSQIWQFSNFWSKLCNNFQISWPKLCDNFQISWPKLAGKTQVDIFVTPLSPYMDKHGHFCTPFPPLLPTWFVNDPKTLNIIVLTSSIWYPTFRGLQWQVMMWQTKRTRTKNRRSFFELYMLMWVTSAMKWSLFTNCCTFIPTHHKLSLRILRFLQFLYRMSSMKIAHVYRISKGAILGGASSARALPLFLPRPESIYISRFFGVKIPRNSSPRPIVHHHFLALIGAPEDKA